MMGKVLHYGNAWVLQEVAQTFHIVPAHLWFHFLCLTPVNSLQALQPREPETSSSELKHCSTEFCFCDEKELAYNLLSRQVGRCGQWHNSQMEITVLLSRSKVIHKFLIISNY